jgi:hypothetical protein
MTLALTSTERARLIASGHVVVPKRPDEVSERRELWQAAVKKARAAFDELAYAERAYMAAVARSDARASRQRMPKKDPYAVPREAAA